MRLLPVLLASALIILPQAASAGWNPAAPRDGCLVGTWKMTAGGAEEWMRRNIHMAHVTHTSATNNFITLKSDGSFATGQVHTRAEIEAGDHGMRGTGTMDSKASGHWSASAGRLTMYPEQMTSHGKVTITGPDGRPITVNTQQVRVDSSVQSYTCARNSFTTTQPMGRGTPMTTTYTKTR